MFSCSPSSLIARILNARMRIFPFVSASSTHPGIEMSIVRGLWGKSGSQSGSQILLHVGSQENINFIPGLRNEAIVHVSKIHAHVSTLRDAFPEKGRAPEGVARTICIVYTHLYIYIYYRYSLKQHKG